MLKKLISLMLVVILTVSVFAPLSSAQINKENGYNFDESIPKEQMQSIINIIEDENFEKEVNEGLLLQPYINAEGELIEFDHEQALKDGISPELVKQAKEDYEKANKYLIEEQQKVTQNNVIFNNNQLARNVKANCGGVNKFTGNLVAGTVYIDSCKTTKMIAIITGGGAASSLIALLPAGAAIAVVAIAIYTIGGAVLSYNNADGTGVKVRILKNPVTGKIYPYWVNPQ